MKSPNKLKQFWNWLWHSDSWQSYVVFILLVFLFIKFIFFPILSLIMGTTLPLAIVESSSMDHGIVKDSAGRLALCGEFFVARSSINFNKYWDTCGYWYEPSINQEQFKEFPFSNGFKKGDLMIIIGVKEPKVGDVLVFEAGSQHPLIHRVVDINPLQTKGDHNVDQLPTETSISEDQLIGKAVARIPFVGWLKLIFVEMFR